jgi:hypothetical protein
MFEKKDLSLFGSDSVNDDPRVLIALGVVGWEQQMTGLL